ncbi:MAG: hypothetical protein LBP22_14130 [Deltaproteobacteria bacterium]|jgi:hypothetical protein|nr:hypothetical protein [Deltaproteobacteria bacterium]
MGKLLIFGVLMSLAVISPAAARDNRNFMWWQMTDQSQAPDGGHLIYYNLNLREQAGTEDLEVIFLFSPYRKDGAVRAFGTGQFYKKLVAPNQRKFTFYGGQSGKMEVFAKARTGGRTFYAQTIMSTFGQSGLTDPEAVPAEMSLDWPKWRLGQGDRFYRAQVGRPLDLSFSQNPNFVQVFEDQVVMGNFRFQGRGPYVYTPSPGQGLARSGYTARKTDLVSVAFLDNGDRASFSLPVYRAYYSQLDYNKGFLVMGIFLAGTLGLVTAKGRRFQGL